MKKIFSILFLYTVLINAQDFKFGFTGYFLTGNKYLNYEVGPTFMADY